VKNYYQYSVFSSIFPLTFDSLAASPSLMPNDKVRLCCLVEVRGLSSSHVILDVGSTVFSSTWHGSSMHENVLF
jgi:hypothetical protein